MTDEAGKDFKILAVPTDKLCKSYHNIKCIDDVGATLKDQIEQLETAAKTADIAPATEASGGAKAAIMLQTIRTSFSQHKNRADDDDTEWKKKEVAIGNAIQQLLAMVQKSPDSRDMVYGLLNDLQGILDAGRKLVKRNRQFLEDKETVISELENQL
jgi:hypothetical protein